jgi:radical SAM superfamily enzyme YgiQ (UPF0313 family)
MNTRKTDSRFHLVLIKPSHYDDDGYVIQWFRAAFPSNSLGVLNALALDCNDRRVLGPDVEIETTVLDETNTRLRPTRLARQLRQTCGLVALVGVQSNQFPRAMDIARPFRAAGIPVIIGGFHVSGCLTMLPEVPAELREAMDLGISLFAGEAEGRLDTVLKDAWEGTLKPLYNYLEDLPKLEGAVIPMLPAGQSKRTSGRLTSFDAGRGCPFQCSFCTIINVQGRKARYRSADEVERIVRRNVLEGNNRFFITDDNFARNRNWENIFDRLILLREKERLNIKFVLQVDVMCHKIPRFIEKASRAGVARIFIGLESIHADRLLATNKPQNQIADYRRMLLEWKRTGTTVIAGYILGFPNDSRETILRDIDTIKRELPLDLLEFTCMTPLPGSEDYRRLLRENARMDPDLNRYDLEHVVMDHAQMSRSEWEQAYRDAWASYYTPEHCATVLRRVVTFGKHAGGNLPILFAWFYSYCIALENVHPLQGGYLRRKYRRDRRPTLPLENPLVFYSRYLAGLLHKLYAYAKIAKLIWHYSRIRRQARQSLSVPRFTDAALSNDALDFGPPPS